MGLFMSATLALCTGGRHFVLHNGVMSNDEEERRAFAENKIEMRV